MTLYCTGNRPVRVQAEPAQSLRFFTPALLNQHVGQALTGGPVAGVGQGAKLLQVTAAGQQIGQPPGGLLVAGVGPGAQPVQVAALGQQRGQRTAAAVASVGPGAQPVQITQLG